MTKIWEAETNSALGGNKCYYLDNYIFGEKLEWKCTWLSQIVKILAKYLR